MGLDIGFTQLKTHLEWMYSDDAKQSSIVERSLAAIIDEANRQGNKKTLAEPADVPQDRERLGSYSSLHVLRLYAARMAGFLLDEAYDLPLLEINTTSPAPEDESTLDSLESYDDELSEEDLFERDTGLKIDVVFPKPEKINPFPFKNLVCFSDASGIYIPLEFSEPFIVDGLYVGSSIGLQSELLRLELGLKAALLSVLETHNEPLEAFLLGVRQLWWGLYGPCERSLLLNTSMYFG